MFRRRLCASHLRLAQLHPGCFSFPLKMVLLLVCLIGTAVLHAQTISGTVEDPSGAVIAGARIEITSADLAQPVVFDSGGLGKFVSPDLKPGTYSVRVTRDLFEPLTRMVELKQAV